MVWSKNWQRSGSSCALDDEINANLEAAEIQRRVYAAGGPAVFFTNVTGCRFPLVSNLFGTIERRHDFSFAIRTKPCGGRLS